MKLNKLIGSFFIFAASLTIIGFFGATASFAQNKEITKEHRCTRFYRVFLENRDGPELHKLYRAYDAGFELKSFGICGKDKEITDYLEKIYPKIKKEMEAGNFTPRMQLRQFCDDIFIGVPPQVQGYAPIGVEFSYNYEYRFWKLAGVDPAKDTEETGVLKVKKWLNKNNRDMICNDNRSFPVPNGGILKYAVYHHFTHIIDAFMITYEADVNFRDYVDGKTFLDYIDDEIKKSDPTGREPNESTRTLQGYRNKYRQLGARTSAEVESEKRRNSGKP